MYAPHPNAYNAPASKSYVGPPYYQPNIPPANIQPYGSYATTTPANIQPYAPYATKVSTNVSPQYVSQPPPPYLSHSTPMRHQAPNLQTPQHFPQMYDNNSGGYNASNPIRTTNPNVSNNTPRYATKNEKLKGYISNPNVRDLLDEKGTKVKISKIYHIRKTRPDAVIYNSSDDETQKKPIQAVPVAMSRPIEPPVRRPPSPSSSSSSSSCSHCSACSNCSCSDCRHQRNRHYDDNCPECRMEREKQQIRNHHKK